SAHSPPGRSRRLKRREGSWYALPMGALGSRAERVSQTAGATPFGNTSGRATLLDLHFARGLQDAVDCGAEFGGAVVEFLDFGCEFRHPLLDLLHFGYVPVEDAFALAA